MQPVVASIILGARGLTAVDAFADRYRLDDLAVQVARLLDGIDVLLLPTVPDVPTLAEVAADPLGTNTALGRYTTFVNLLGMCAVSVPGAGRPDGVPGGVSVVARGGDDHLALQVAPLVVQATAPRGPAGGGRGPPGRPAPQRGADRAGRRPPPVARRRPLPTGSMPWPRSRPSRASSGSRTAASSVEVEVWALAPAAFGDFVAAVPPPLAIGKVELEDGSWVPGFVCEPAALAGAPDITSSGGWRAYLLAPAGP